MQTSPVRVDAWTWSVRFYKTRTAASSACRAGHVRVNGVRVKPSSQVGPGDRLEALTESGRRIVTVTSTVSKRVGAAVAVTCFEDHTPPPPPREEILDVPRRDRGAGRPTKRDRRRLDRLENRP